MNNYETFEQTEEPRFDYPQVEELARKSLDPNLTEDTQKKIKKIYGSCVEPFEKCPAYFKMFQLEVDRQRLLMAKEKGEAPKINTRSISYDTKQKIFIYKSKNNYDVKVTAGDLVSDLDWELYYDIDDQAHPELAEFKKDYFDKIFSRQIGEVENEQLLIERIEIDKVAKHDISLSDAYVATYEALIAKKKKRQRGENTIDRRSGFVFEKILSGLLRKLAYDLGKKWDFDILDVNADDDVRDKLDMILKVFNRHRGLSVEKELTPEETKKGFQVTLMKYTDIAYHRKHQKVEKMRERIQRAKRFGEKPIVDDVALISPGEKYENVAGFLKTWERQGMVPGGPENFLEIEKIVDKYLKEIFKGTRLDFEKNPDFVKELKQYFEGKR